VADLKAAYAKSTKMDIHRLSFRKDGNRLDKDSDSLDIYEVKSNDSLEMKDLGPQIGYRTVFVIEYLGPMLFVLLYTRRPAMIYGPVTSSVPYQRAALIGIICWVDHLSNYSRMPC
jgi:very-long-chain enoyl-CoA reductase